MTSLHNQRGQTLPIWAFGTLTVLTMLVLALSYGQMVAWQMRAMNAADAAAKGMLSVQTTQWNETEATLHASAVEEYRLRGIMNDLLEVIRDSGGCSKTGSGSTSCSTIYTSLRHNYLDSLARYTADVSAMGRLSWPTFSEQVSEIQAALAQYQANCGQTDGGDCAFNYTLVEATPRPTTYLEDVYADCCNWEVGGDTSGNPKLDLTPMEIEIVACANVKPWLPNFWHWNAPAYQVVGRAAAMSIMDTQEFMWVGSLEDPSSTTGAVFQPTEYPESSSNSSLGLTGSDEYYQVDFGYDPSGNTYTDSATSDGNSAYSFSNLIYPGMQVADGWWTAMAIKPFAGKLTAGVSFTCK